MKVTQWNVLTKEWQARLSTGSDPEEKIPEIDPNIVLVVSNLFETASTQFSSDLSETEIQDECESY